MVRYIETYNLLLIFIILFLLIADSAAQPETARWQEQEIRYTLPEITAARDYGINASSAADFLTQAAANLYWITISDVDGDNCPFEPSCSSFLIAAVKDEGLITGSLMFADRFLRDINFFNRNSYPIHLNGHLYDPHTNYTPSGSYTYYPSGKHISVK